MANRADLSNLTGLASALRHRMLPIVGRPGRAATPALNRGRRRRSAGRKEHVQRVEEDIRGDQRGGDQVRGAAEPLEVEHRQAREDD
jgi:hypothetical protein